MSQISRLYNFQDGTVAIADQIDEELNQLIEVHNDHDTKLETHFAQVVDPESTDETRNKHVSNQDIKSVNDQLSDLYTGGLDARYYTKTALEPYLTGGDTLIVEEVFTIINPNVGDGTFTYKNKSGATLSGTIDGSGNQIFTLENGNYQLGGNRIYALLNDSVRRSVSSGGLIEIETNQVAIVPQPVGMEITFVYFQRAGLTGEHNVIVGRVQPPQGNDNTLWLKEVD